MPFSRSATDLRDTRTGVGATRALRQLALLLLLPVVAKSDATARSVSVSAGVLAMIGCGAEDTTNVEVVSSVTRQDDTTLTVYINVPAQRIDVAERDSQWSALVAVGAPRYPTPVGSFRIETVEWNPWWIPPESDWAKDEKPTPPGPTNPMGKVKLKVVGLTYIHGTPSVHSLGSAASHGCIRVHDSTAVRLALSVHKHALDEQDEDALAHLIASRSPTRRYTVGGYIPVVIDYRLAEVRHDTAWVYPDVYRKAPGSARHSLLQALTRAAFDTLLVRPDSLDALLSRGRKAKTGVPVDHLISR